MKLIFRLIWLLLTHSRRGSVDIMESADTPFRVLPNDLDVFLHVNNGVYLTYADLGRTDLMLRSGIFHKVRKHGWYPVVAAETILFKKSLTVFQRFSINTQVAGWDDRALYIEHVYTRGDVLVAHAFIEVRFLARTGEKVKTEELLDFLDVDRASPALPESLQRWIAARR